MLRSRAVAFPSAWTALGSGVGDLVEPIGDAARDRRRRPQLRPTGIRNLDLAEVAGVVGQRAPQRDELLGELPAPRPGVGLQRPASAGGEQGIAAPPPPGGRAPEDLVEAIQDLLRIQIQRVDLVRHLSEFVDLVHDHMLEAGVVRRPAQHQIVVCDDQIRTTERSTTTTQRTALFGGALLPRALLRPGRHGAAQERPQRRVAAQQRCRDAPDLAVGTDLGAGLQHGVCQAVFREDALLPPLVERERETTGTGVVRSTLDRDRSELRRPQEARGGGDVAVQQLILEELGAGRDHQGGGLSGGGPLHGEGNRRRQVGQGLSDPRTSFHQQDLFVGQVSDEPPGQPDLLLPDPVVGEVAAPASLVRQRGGDGLLVEGNRRLPGLPDLDELGFHPIR